jgi:hypothetical protein
MPDLMTKLAIRRTCGLLGLAPDRHIHKLVGGRTAGILPRVLAGGLRILPRPPNLTLVHGDHEALIPPTDFRIARRPVEVAVILLMLGSVPGTRNNM